MPRQRTRAANCHAVRRCAFTLIELLVVIAIIALLISILLPALGNARRSAQLLISQTNLRSLSQIGSLYNADNKGSFINPFNENYDRTGGYGSWARVRKPGYPGVWEFNGPGKWYSEMYAFHWYSLVANELREGDWASDVQFAPLDPEPKNRFLENVVYNDNYDHWQVIWDTSYVLSPTLWYAPERYRDLDRPTNQTTSAAASLVRRNRIDNTVFASSKVVMWERFDNSKKSRTPTWKVPGLDINIVFDMQPYSPNWNNPQASPTVATADGSVARVDMIDLYERAADDDPERARAWIPTDQWNPNSSNTLAPYAMANDHLENASQEDPGAYPAYFWATRDGIQGRDIPR